MMSAQKARIGATRALIHSNVDTASTSGRMLDCPDVAARSLTPMDEHPDNADVDVELERVTAQPMRLEGRDSETGERVEGVVYADHLMAAIDERDEQR